MSALEIYQSLLGALLALRLRSVSIISLLEILSWTLPGDFDISLLDQFIIELSDNLVGFPFALHPKVSTSSSAVTYCAFILSPRSPRPLLSLSVRLLFSIIIYTTTFVIVNKFSYCKTSRIVIVFVLGGEKAMNIMTLEERKELGNRLKQARKRERAITRGARQSHRLESRNGFQI